MAIETREERLKRLKDVRVSLDKEMYLFLRTDGASTMEAIKKKEREQLLYYLNGV